MVKVNSKSQKGRSMVEMLGVLAIIGVLSVGGVYGYGVAMKKHKANELLHQASMLATTISAKALTNDGVLPETITDFGNSGYATTLSDNGTKFILTMKDVDSAVCDQLKTGGMIQGVECKAGTSDGKMNAEITYYKNLATNETEGEKSPTGGSSGSSCKSGVVKVYNCETKTTTDCCPDNGNKCEQPTNCNCSADSDCPRDQFCLEGVCACMEFEFGAHLGTDGETCCYSSGSAWSDEPEGYTLAKPEVCGGCPEDGSFGTDGKTCCSADGYGWNNGYGGYYDVKLQICGCPMPLDGTTHAPAFGTDGKTCCRDGLAWYDRNGNYTAANLSCGGCPEEGKVGKDSKTCCKDGKSWDDYQVYYASESEVCQGI